MIDPLSDFDDLSGPPDNPPEPPKQPRELRAAGAAVNAARDVNRYAVALAYFEAARSNAMARLTGKPRTDLRLPFVDFKFASGSKPDTFTLDTAQLDEVELRCLEPLLGAVCAMVNRELQAAWERVREAYNDAHGTTT